VVQPVEAALLTGRNLPCLLSVADTVPAALMRGFRRDIRNARQAAAERANEWLICPRHGGYSPNVRSPRGWVRQDCPGCTRERYEAGTISQPIQR
jgi:hypothetical protein